MSDESTEIYERGLLLMRGYWQKLCDKLHRDATDRELRCAVDDSMLACAAEQVAAVRGCRHAAGVLREMAKNLDRTADRMRAGGAHCEQSQSRH